MGKLKIRVTAILSAIVLSFVGVLSYTQISVSAEDLPGKIIFYNQDFNDDWMNEYFIRDKTEINNYLSILYTTSDYIEFKNNHHNVYILVWNTCFNGKYYISSNRNALGYKDDNEIFILVSSEPINFTNLLIDGNYKDLTYRTSPQTNYFYKNYENSFNRYIYDIDYGNNDYFGYRFNTLNNYYGKLNPGDLSNIKFSNISNCDLNNIIIASNYNYSIDNEIIDRYDSNQITSDFTVSVTPTPELNLESTYTVKGKREDVTYNTTDMTVKVDCNFEGDKNYISSWTAYISDVDPATYTIEKEDGNLYFKEEFKNHVLYMPGVIRDKYYTREYGLTNDDWTYTLCEGYNYSFVPGKDYAGFDFKKFKMKKGKSYWIVVVANKADVTFSGEDYSFLWDEPLKLQDDFWEEPTGHDFFPNNSNFHVFMIYSAEFSFKNIPTFEGNSSLPNYSFEDAATEKPIMLTDITTDKTYTYSEFKQENENYEDWMDDTYRNNNEYNLGFSDINGIDDLISNLKSGSNGMMVLLKSSISILPDPIPSLLVASFIIVITGFIIIALIKFIRG